MKATDLPLDEVRERAAAAWLARRDRGLTRAETEAFETWLANDVRNAEALQELEESFHALDGIETLKEPTAVQPDPDFLLKHAASKKPYSSSAKVINFKAWIAVTAAAAAVVLLTFNLSQSPLAPAPVTARADGTLIRHAAETMALADGSVIELKPGAKVEVDFKPGERRVRLLSGEAHFTVAKDAARPFIVAVSDLSVRAVGTAFNVRLADAQVEVLVTEGKVAVRDAVVAGRVSSNPIDVPLVTGDRAIVSAKGLNRVVVASVGAAEVDRELEWRAVWLEFAEMRLGDVVNEFNRHNGGRLAVADEDTGSVLVSGKFKADGSDAFVRILESSFGVAAEKRDNAVVLKRQR